MTPSRIFSIVNAIALIAWIVLVIFPRRRWTLRATGIAVPAIFAAIYIAIIVTTWGRSSGGFGTLSDVALLFANPWLLLAGWIHYLAFDLFVGTWEVRDAGQRGIPHLLVVPCLALTFLFGPAGWMLYRAITLAYRAELRDTVPA